MSETQAIQAVIEGSKGSLTIEGGCSLVGDVRISGAKNSAVKLIAAALFSNEDIILENVPRIDDVATQIQIVKALGGVCEWVGKSSLIINGSSISSFEVPLALGTRCRSTALMVAPLLFRFGKAIIPKPGGSAIGHRPINRWFDTWEALGYEVLEDPHFLIIRIGGLKPATIDFKINTHTGTDNAILSSLFISGETNIVNAAEESEVDDLLNFCKMMNASVTRIEPRVIKVEGKNVFKGGSFSVQPDKEEVITYATAAIITMGNITLKQINREHILSFVSFMSKMGCKYEFSGDEMRVWSTGEKLEPVDVTTAPAPGFLTNWQPFASLLLTKADGDSTVHETIYTDRFSYAKELNRMGAKMQLFTPSDLGLKTIISDDMYNTEKFGEPRTVLRIHGPTKLKGTSIEVLDIRSGAALAIAALAADGKSTLHNASLIDRGYETFFKKLANLGAVIND